MNTAKALIYHRILFIYVALLSLFIAPFIVLLPSYVVIALSLLLFFGLGIPHGALDVAIGKLLFRDKMGRLWPLLFFGGYVAVSLLIVGIWLEFPLICFLFFLAISAFHFGFSDTESNGSTMGFLEAISRGLLPICVPAYYNRLAFSEIIECSLLPNQALYIMNILSWLVIPTILFLFASILIKICRKQLYGALELASLLLLFIFLPPFVAFLVYFCFLHSIRHILNVLVETNQNLNSKSIKWMVLEALPTTLCTMLTLFICYLALQKGVVDLACMVNIFFISIAALTVPHMILVELVKHKPGTSV
jgi:Brp/Blh family beta-carotene 15,15'-monooxygenase